MEILRLCGGVCTGHLPVRRFPTRSPCSNSRSLSAVGREKRETCFTALSHERRTPARVHRRRCRCPAADPGARTVVGDTATKGSSAPPLPTLLHSNSECPHCLVTGLLLNLFRAKAPCFEHTQTCPCPPEDRSLAASRALRVQRSSVACSEMITRTGRGTRHRCNAARPHRASRLPVASRETDRKPTRTLPLLPVAAIEEGGIAIRVSANREAAARLEASAWLPGPGATKSLCRLGSRRRPCPCNDGLTPWLFLRPSQRL